MWKVNIKLGWCFSCKLQYYSSFHLAFSRSANQKVIYNNGGIRGTSPIYSSYRSVIVSGWINSKASLTRRTFGFIFGLASWLTDRWHNRSGSVHILRPAFSSLSSDFKALFWVDLGNREPEDMEPDAAAAFEIHPSCPCLWITSVPLQATTRSIFNQSSRIQRPQDLKRAK